MAGQYAPGFVARTETAAGYLASAPKRFFNLPFLTLLALGVAGVLYLSSLLALLVYIQQDQSFMSRLMVAQTGYNILFTISIVTLAMLVASGLGGFATWFLALPVRPDYKGAFTSLLNLSAAGTALGALAAALSPILMAALGMKPVFSGGSTILVGPSVLLEMSALGGIGGYAVGLITALLRLGHGFKNGVYRCFFYPALFGIIFTLLLLTGVTPRGLESRVFGEEPAVVEALSTECLEVVNEGLSAENPCKEADLIQELEDAGLLSPECLAEIRNPEQHGNVCAPADLVTISRLDGNSALINEWVLGVAVNLSVALAALGCLVRYAVRHKPSSSNAGSSSPPSSTRGTSSTAAP